MESYSKTAKGSFSFPTKKITYKDFNGLYYEFDCNNIILFQRNNSIQSKPHKNFFCSFYYANPTTETQVTIVSRWFTKKFIKEILLPWVMNKTPIGDQQPLNLE